MFLVLGNLSLTQNKTFSWYISMQENKLYKALNFNLFGERKPVTTQYPYLNLDSRCLEDLKPGNCGEYVVRWYYDKQVNSCARFWFSGCNGSGNRFSSEKECQEICIQG